MMKRKKPSSPTHETVSVIRTTKKPSKDSFYIEEELAQSVDPQECVTKYRQCCSQLRELAKEIHEAKAAKQKSHDFSECMMPMLEMKELNRSAQFCLKKIRENTQEKKTQIDQHHLKRQNLLYEVMHLQKEISRCLEFRSKHEDINLIPLEEFYEEAPKSISRPEVTREDLHAQTLARLTWDLEQRKELAEKLKLADESMEIARKEIQAKKDYLNGLLPKLREIMETTKPVQDYMDISFSKETDQNSMASLLPSALYTLFIEVKAYSQARDSSVTVSVEGDTDEARAVRSQFMEIRVASSRRPYGSRSSQTHSHEPVLDSEPSDEEETPQAAGLTAEGAGEGGNAADKRSGSPGSQEKGRRRRRGTKSMRSAGEEALNELLRLHPLSVIVQIKMRGSVILRIHFHYAMSLRVVTVKVKLDLPYGWDGDSNYSESPQLRDLLQPQSLLSYVYQGDSGQASGLHVLRHEMQKANVSSLTPFADRLGCPYVWVQRLAGLDLFPTVVERLGPRSSKCDDGLEGQSCLDISAIPPPNLDVAFDHSVECFARIKRRISARIAFIRELSAIERNEWRLTESQQNLVPLKQITRLKHWRRACFEDFQKLPQAEKFIKEDMVHSYDFFYTGTLERDIHPRVRATVHVIVPVDYPSETPICFLTIPCPIPGSPPLTSETCLQVQEMETVVNCNLSEFSLNRGEEWTPGNGFLACQLQRLFCCFDVFMENEWCNVSEDPSYIDRRVPSNIRVYRTTKYPSRRMPYKYSQAFDTFVQR